MTEKSEKTINWIKGGDVHSNNKKKSEIHAIPGRISTPLLQSKTKSGKLKKNH